MMYRVYTCIICSMLKDKITGKGWMELKRCKRKMEGKKVGRGIMQELRRIIMSGVTDLE